MSVQENTFGHLYQRHGHVGNDGQRSANPSSVVFMPVDLQQRPPPGGGRNVERAAQSAFAAPHSALEAGRRGQVGYRNDGH